LTLPAKASAKPEEPAKRIPSKEDREESFLRSSIDSASEIKTRVPLVTSFLTISKRLSFLDRMQDRGSSLID